LRLPPISRQMNASRLSFNEAVVYNRLRSRTQFAAIVYATSDWCRHLATARSNKSAYLLALYIFIVYCVNTISSIKPEVHDVSQRHRHAYLKVVKYVPSLFGDVTAVTLYTSYFHHNLQHHRTITSDATPMTDNCINTKDTRVTVIL